MDEHDIRNAQIKAEFEARPDRAELEAKYNMEYGDRSIRPEDLAPKLSTEEYIAQNDKAFANWEQEQAKKAAAPAADGESVPMEVTPEEVQVTETLRQELGEQYETFIADGGRGLQSLFQSLGITTQKQAEAALLKSGILKNSAALEKMMRSLAELGKTSRR